LATKKIKKPKVKLEGHPYPHGGLDYGKNHPTVPKQYGQQFKVDSTYYRLSGKPTLGLPMGSVESTSSNKLPKPAKNIRSKKKTK